MGVNEFDIRNPKSRYLTRGWHFTNAGFLEISHLWEINPKFFLNYDSGCVTKWYQSMVTTLDLTGLMHQSHQSRINLVRNTPIWSNPLT